IEYTHGPKIPIAAKWKAGQDLSVRILFEDLNQTLHRESFEGTWSWYRLLDASSLRKVDPNRYTVTIMKDTRRADYQLEADTRASGLDLGLLRSYRCPDKL
ncbi:MAG TPA: type VI secretion IcmF C-terminal domain-containing protein, partial [Dongiaceae bacterium]|nr:type VI secretion IcmF C-terminal domain-containing protein [Dongiaceae bacterium]